MHPLHGFGVVTMFLATAAMLWNKGLFPHAFVMGIVPIVFLLFAAWLGTIHRGQGYVKIIDNRNPHSGQIEQSALKPHKRRFKKHRR